MHVILQGIALCSPHSHMSCHDLPRHDALSISWFNCTKVVESEQSAKRVLIRGENVAYRILIADDSEAIRDVLREALVDEGYEVSEAASGDEVLAEFNSNGAV